MWDRTVKSLFIGTDNKSFVNLKMRYNWMPRQDRIKYKQSPEQIITNKLVC